MLWFRFVVLDGSRFFQENTVDAMRCADSSQFLFGGVADEWRNASRLCKDFLVWLGSTSRLRICPVYLGNLSRCGDVRVFRQPHRVFFLEVPDESD